MYCPECRSEYREGFTTCADCGAALVDELPPEPQPEYQDYITVMTVTEPVRLSAARAVLEKAGIAYNVLNEDLQDLFAMGRVGAGFNPIIGPTQLQVASECVEVARELLADIGNGSLEDFEEE